MERRTFILGMGSFLVGACASKPGLQPGQNPYAAGSTAARPTAPCPAPPTAPGARPPVHVHTADGDCLHCAPGGVHYLTRRGDTLRSISARYGVAPQAICRANPRRISADRVVPGRLIWLPGAKPVACEVVSTGVRPVASTGEAPAVVRDRPTPRVASRVRVVSRSDWGAQSLKPNHDPMNGVRRITLHHTDEVPGIRARSDREIVSAIQRYHRNNLGWADIGYHYLIGRDGLVYEGRPAFAQGAHSGGANNIQNLGIAVIGNFSHSMPSAGQMGALKGFLADQQRVHRVNGGNVYGHRDFGSTECPGTTLYGWMKQRRFG